jgi:Carboxypeptidase regulatory-like domain
MRRLHSSGWLPVLLVCAGVCQAWAQSGTASLTGTITDQQKANLPAATVTLANEATGFARETVANESGEYSFAAVPPGTYRLTITLDGFRTAIVENLVLQVDTTSRQDIELTVGGVAESVQVTAEAALVNTSDASMGNVISGTQIRALPLEARNVVGLLSLQPGVTFVPSPVDAEDPRYGSVSGARGDQSNVTLDGIDVNDPQNQTAFTTVLRVTLDAVQEFRVTTSNYGADQGRSSGAQISLVTRSGTNELHGAGYYVNRDTKFSSNEYFLKLSQLKSDDPSEPPKLDKNIYGFSLGGPIRKDKFFLFGNFEGLDESRETVATRAVPSMSLRDGILIYRCSVPAQCPGGTVQGLSATHTVPAGSYGLNPSEVRQLDPLGLGPSQTASQYFRRYPTPNDPGRYPGNIEAFRFAAPLENTFRTYLARGDYRISGSQTLFGRFNLQDDAVSSTPQFPEQASNTTRTDKNWGIATGWDATFGTNLVNTFRYGYTLINTDTIGQRNSNLTSFRFIDHFDFATNAFSNGREIGTNNIVNDLSWIKGRHTLKFGTNMRWVRNDSYTFENSFLSGVANASWTNGVGRRFMPGRATCTAPICNQVPAVAAAGASAYADSFIPILGVISQTSATYNNTIDGTVLAIGEPVLRLFAADEYEFYVQDSWRVSDTLTISGGLRYSLFSPPYEANGQQVAPNTSMGAWFDERVRNMQAGIPSNESPRVSFVPAGPANDGPGFYPWDKNNWAPRVSFAWTPGTQWVVRGGYGLVYDRIGAGLATTFNNGGAFGLSTDVDSPVNQNNENTPGIRYTDSATIPRTYPDPPPASFPATPEVGAGVITLSIDDNLRTPYSHAFNFVVGRELGRNMAVEAAYVGRRGRSLLVRRDLAMPLNLTDRRSGVDYFTAATQLIAAIEASGGNYSRIAPIAYWENLFPDAAGGGLTATQAMAAAFDSVAPDWMTAIWGADQFCDPACSVFGPFAYFAEQYDSLAAQSTLARSEYDALQLVFRKRYSDGYQFDVNYTFARGKDHASEVERGAAFGNFGSGGYSGFLVNSFDPDLNYSYSDYDLRHQINVNWLAELPFGQGKRFGNGVGTWTNALIGDWAIAGIWRWSSGFPFNVINCRSCWATNWNLQGNAALATPGQLPPLETNKDAVDGFPSPFADPMEALDFFRLLNPGEAGVRNLMRGDGYFTIDLSLSKAFRMPFGDRLQFRWDVFNVTNTPRFDTGAVTMFPDSAASFGRYDGSLAACDRSAGRCMQLNLRYQF